MTENILKEVSENKKERLEFVTAAMAKNLALLEFYKGVEASERKYEYLYDIGREIINNYLLELDNEFSLIRTK